MNNNKKLFKRFSNVDRIIAEIQKHERNLGLDTQPTDTGSKLIKVLFFDKANEAYTEPQFIKRAALAKAYSAYKVLGSKDGLTVIEL